MKKQDEALKKAEAFVREALKESSDRPVKESTVKSVARKVVKAIPARDRERDCISA